MNDFKSIVNSGYFNNANLTVADVARAEEIWSADLGTLK